MKLQNAVFSRAYLVTLLSVLHWVYRHAYARTTDKTAAQFQLAENAFQ